MSQLEDLEAVQYGVGPIGSRIVQTALERGVRFVGAVDIDPEKVGTDLGSLVSAVDSLGVRVTDNVSEALSSSPQLVFHSTVSSLEAATPQLVEILRAGANVVSTTEELSYPWERFPEAASRIDEEARNNGVTCLGTGINPGFAMDVFPAILSSGCRSLDEIRVQRVQDAALRREPLQKKVGAGMSVGKFKRTIAREGGHVGLIESLQMLTSALGWELDRVEDELHPVLAEQTVSSSYLTVQPGDVAGVHQVAKGYRRDRCVLELDLKMFLGGDPLDRVLLRGQPDLEVRVEGGFHGDLATPAVVCNVVPRVLRHSPGLATMIDLPLPSFGG